MTSGPHIARAGSAGTRLRGVLSLTLLGILAGCDAGEPDRGSPAGSDSLAAAESDSVPTGAPDSPPVALVDTAIAPAVAGQDGWMYTRSAEADLDGDGTLERVVLTARAELVRGRPAWDDGQPWQAYVEEAEGDRTYLYARFVQLGKVTMRIGREEAGHPSTVILLEHVPDRLAIYEIEYEGPGAAHAVTRFERMVDPTGELASPDLP